MPSVRGTGVPKSQQIRLAKALSTARDRVFGHLCITQRKDAKSKNWLYALAPQDESGDPDIHHGRSGGPSPSPAGPSQLDLLPDRSPASGSAAPSMLPQGPSQGHSTESRAVCAPTYRPHTAGHTARPTEAHSTIPGPPAVCAVCSACPPRPTCARADAHACMCAHTHGEGGFDIPHPPHIPPDSADPSESKTSDDQSSAVCGRYVVEHTADLSQFGDPDDEPGGEDDP